MSLGILLIPLALAVTTEVSQSVAEYVNRKKQDYILLQTRMKDENLMKQALNEWNCKFRQLDEDQPMQNTQEDEAYFILNEEGRYMLAVPNSTDQQQYEQWITELEQAYTHYLQQAVYQRLTEKARQRGMSLEKEEILEDNSIQMTYILNKNQ